MKKLLIIKLGGSVITTKNSSKPKFNSVVVKQIARQIKELCEDYQFILVHGGGSFGHPLAKKYKLTEGLKSEDQKIGFSETSEAMIKLNQLVLVEFLKCKLPVISVPPHNFVTMNDKKIDRFDISFLKKYLVLGFIPILYGDVVLDGKQGVNILSGDIIIPYLANKLNPEKVIFLSDVDGIFDKNPKINKEAKLIKEINNLNYDEIFNGFIAHNEYDVTGEIAGKLQAIKRDLKSKEIYIGNGYTKNILIDLIRQLTPTYTRVLVD